MALTRPRYSNIIDTDFKQFVTVVTTVNITLTGGAPNLYDSYSFAAGDRVLVAGQTTGSQNGIYTVQTVGSGSNGTWIRSSDASSASYLVPGTSVPVTQGTYAGSTWKLTTPAGFVVGTTALTFVAGSTTAGGLPTQIQYNLAGVSTGSANVTIASGNLNVASNVVLSGNLWQGNRAGHGISYTTQSATPPATPLLGDIWYDTSTDAIYEWFTDGVSTFWKDTATVSGSIGYSQSAGISPTAPRVGDQWYDTTVDVLYEYITDGAGNYFWKDTSTVSGSSGYTSSAGVPPTAPRVGDQWYDTTTDTLYEYVTNGTSYYWVDFTTRITQSTVTQTSALILSGNITAACITANSTIVAAGGWAGSGSAAGIFGGIPFVYVCERSGVGAAGQIMSYGNGSSTSLGLLMPFGGKLYFANLIGPGVTGTLTLQLYYNGVVYQNYQLTQTNAVASTVAQTLDLRSAPFVFNSGDTIGWYIASAPSTANAYQVMYFVVYN